MADLILSWNKLSHDQVNELFLITKDLNSMQLSDSDNEDNYQPLCDGMERSLYTFRLLMIIR